MTYEYQNAAIRSAFTNEDILPKEKDLKISIGNRANLIQPHNNACSHVPTPRVDALLIVGR